MSKSHDRDPQTEARKTYEAPHLVRYGRIEELTHGVNHITVNVTDLLSVQS